MNALWAKPTIKAVATVAAKPEAVHPNVRGDRGETVRVKEHAVQAPPNRVAVVIADPLPEPAMTDVAGTAGAAAKDKESVSPK